MLGMALMLLPGAHTLLWQPEHAQIRRWTAHLSFLPMREGTGPESRRTASARRWPLRGRKAASLQQSSPRLHESLELAVRGIVVLDGAPLVIPTKVRLLRGGSALAEADTEKGTGRFSFSVSYTWQLQCESGR
jgi:hypothetical protein